MNTYAYRLTGYAIKALSDISRARIAIHGQENIPKGALIFAINHFTRMETLFLPYHINRLTGLPIWSLADYSLFSGALGRFLDRVGALSTRNPDRDLMIVKSLLTGESAWIIFPEGRMVKSKKVVNGNGCETEFCVASPEGSRPPHTGTAALALRTEFYRERLRRMKGVKPEEAERIKGLFQLETLERVLDTPTYIVPVNLTYYPIRAKENLLSRLADFFLDELQERYMEEVMTEGTMLLAGVDVDIRFGEPIRISQYMKIKDIQDDINSTQPIGFDDPIKARQKMRTAARKIMARYMSSIYRMTTVNHDHLFATLLKYINEPELSIDEFRNRAFMAATLSFERYGIYRHRCMDINQISLLTDDRYRKISNFLSVAKERELDIDQKRLMIKSNLFDGAAAFHRVRIDNPVSVIANEIEPLEELQSQLKAIARLGKEEVKKDIARKLEEKMVFAFERDYANHFVAGESKRRDVGRPFVIKNPAADIGMVLVHGYMATPMEVKAMAQYFGNLGFWVCVPRLKGHGTSPEDLAARKHMEWVESVEEGYAIVKNQCRKIVVGGFSTGAGLALDLCTRVDDVAAVIAVSPPLKLQNFSARFVPAVNLWNRLMEKLNFESAKKEFVENQPENRHINYVRNPISGLMELERLMDALADKLKKIKVPAMVIQGYGDPVVDPHGSQQVFERLGSEEKEYLLINAGRHGIINGEKAWRVFQAVELFLERVL